MKTNDSLLLANRLDALPVEQSRLQWAHIVRFAKAYGLVVGVVFFLTVVSAYVSISFLTELYSAESELLVKLGRENLDPPATSRNLPLTTGLRREEVTSEIAMIESPDLLSRVVDDIGPAAFKPKRIRPNDLIGQVKFEVKRAVRAVKEQYEEALIALDLKKRLDDRQTAIRSLAENLTVEAKKESDVIVIRLKMPDRDLATQLVRRIVEVYMIRRVDVRQNGGVKEFLDASAEQRRVDLEKVEFEKMNWKQEKGLISSGDQKALLLRQIRELSAESSASLREAENLTRQLEVARAALTSIPAFQRTVQQEDPNTILKTLRERLIDRESERGRALAKYLPESPTIRHIDEEIVQLRGQIEKEKDTQGGTVTTQLNPLRQTLEQKIQQDSIRLEGLRATARMQTSQLAELRTEAASIDRAESKLNDIDRTRQIAEQDYMAITKRKQDADVASELDRKNVSNVSVITAPTANFEPVYPRKLLLMAVALLVGLVGGIGIAMLMHYLKDDIDDPEELEQLIQLPCLGTFSLIESA